MIAGEMTEDFLANVAIFLSCLGLGAITYTSLCSLLLKCLSYSHLSVSYLDSKTSLRSSIETRTERIAHSECTQELTAVIWSRSDHKRRLRN